jgi:hypothetical protein
MNKIYLSLLTLIFCLSFNVQTHAQSTGSYDTAVNFNGSQRKISLYVPTNYTPANKYRLMICLHGLGDSMVTYRNALVNLLSWPTVFPNTIFVCPEAADKNNDFYAPAGGEGIITQSISMAMATYHIDTANVILQGFSLGGRAALRYGLDNYSKIKGLLLNTPAFQGVKEALNGHQTAYGFNYSNAANLPIYITHGATDIAYTNSIDSAYEQLVLADGKVRYIDVPGLGHTIPSSAQMGDVSAFFTSPARAGIDAEAVRFYGAPSVTCSSGALAGKLLFRNTSQTTLTSVKFKYTAGSNTGTYTWTGSLAPFRHAIANITIAGPTSGTNTISVAVDTLNTSVKDSVIANNQQTGALYYFPTPSFQPINEGFEGAAFPPPGWSTEQSGDFYTGWDSDNTIAKTGTRSATAFNTALYFENVGRSDALITPLTFVPSTLPALSFDVSYNYNHYNPPYVVSPTDFADTLEVSISTNCGASYTPLYRRAGAQLATFGNPLLNPLSIQASFQTPADSNWRTELIPLAAYASQNALVKFRYISGMGGFINIDNVRLMGVTGVPQTGAATSWRCYPNPASDILNIENAHSAEATIINTLGQEMKHLTIASDDQQVSLQSLPAGLYILTIRTPDGTQSSTRFLKQ